MFKVGDRVKFVRKGTIGWEVIDWTKDVGFELGNTYTVQKSLPDSVQIEGSIYDFHPHHFELEVATLSELDELISDKDEEGYREVNGSRWSIGKRKQDGHSTVVCQRGSNNPLVVAQVDDIPALCATLLKIKREHKEDLVEVAE